MDKKYLIELLIEDDSSLSREDAERTVDESYIGEYESMTEYAREVVSDILEIDEKALRYIDFELLGRDLRLEGVTELLSHENTVHLFKQ